jgi:hypothetical protein
VDFNVHVLLLPWVETLKSQDFVFDLETIGQGGLGSWGYLPLVFSRRVVSIRFCASTSTCYLMVSTFNSRLCSGPFGIYGP